jgi:hypothetical protein
MNDVSALSLEQLQQEYARLLSLIRQKEQTILVKLMEADIQQYDIAFADETTLQVLKEKDRLSTQKFYMWLFIGGPPSKVST